MIRLGCQGPQKDTRRLRKDRQGSVARPLAQSGIPAGVTRESGPVSFF